jgi:hypothetical protein
MKAEIYYPIPLATASATPSSPQDLQTVYVYKGIHPLIVQETSTSPKNATALTRCGTISELWYELVLL